jgi:hypothetical protein
MAAATVFFGEGPFILRARTEATSSALAASDDCFWASWLAAASLYL